MKKLISIILCLCMTISILAVGVVHAETDVEETKAITVLSDLGILEGFEDGDMRPNDLVTRAQMAKIICRVLNYEYDNAFSANFSDVTSNHWAANAISTAYTLGIINGMGDGTFAPDANVKYQDAVVMIMRALGYDRIAKRESNGGYPTGYLKLASQYGVLKNAGYNNSSAAPRGIIAKLIYNALNAPLVDVSYYGGSVEDDRYIIYDGNGNTEKRTLLTYTNEIVKVDTCVEATHKSDPSNCIDRAGNYLVKFDDYGTVYAGDIDATALLGIDVEAYLKESDRFNGELELLSIVPKTKSIKTETVKSSEIKVIDVKDNEFIYEDNDGKEIELALNSERSIYYNGKKVDTELAPASLKTLLSAAEEITFVGDKVGDYSKIFVTDYSYHMVDKVYAEDLYIKCKDLDLDLDAEKRNEDKFKFNIYNEKGQKISIEDIAADNILNIVAPLTVDANGKVDPNTELATVKYMDIYVSDSTVTGIVTEDYLDGRYAINDEVYKTVDTVLASGKEGTFYLTIDGRIFDYDTTSTASRDFGFIMRAYSESKYGDTVFENTIQLFTGDGELINFTVADRLKVGDVSYTDSSLNNYIGTTVRAIAADFITLEDAQKNLYNRMVTYKLNANGEIRELMFFDDTTSSTMKYRDDINTFGTKKIDSASILFVAPVSEVDPGKYNVDKKDLKIADFASMNPDDTYNASTFVFAGEKSLAAALVSHNIDSSFANTHLAVIKSKGSIYDAEYDSLVKYTLVQSGKTISVNVSGDPTGSVDTNLAAGDVILYTTDINGNIDNMIVVYKNGVFNADKYILDNIKVNDFAIVKGEILSLEDDVMSIDGIGDYLLEEKSNNTYVSIDTTDDVINTNDIDVLRSAASLRASTPINKYTVISIFTENEVFTDCVMIIENK